MNSTKASVQIDLPEIGAILWLHIITSSILSFICVPAIVVCKFQNHRHLKITEGFGIIIILFVAFSGFFVNHKSLFTTAHGILGYLIFLILGIPIIYNAFHGYKKHKSSWIRDLPGWKPLAVSTSFIIVVGLASEIVFGLASLFQFCAYPYTQQCIGHFGIGGWFFVHFGFCVALSLTDGNLLPTRLKQNIWTPEMSDAIFVMPCGVGLAFFGHAWSAPWDTESIQHVFLGSLSIIGSTLGLLLPQRNIFPGLVSLLAGYTFLIHSQDSRYQVLGDLHRSIGWLLCGIGICRVLDIGFAFYLPNGNDKNLFASPCGYLASFLGISAGLVIMSANIEEAVLLDSADLGSGAVILGLFSMTMGIYAYLYLFVKAATLRKKAGYEVLEMNES